MKKILALLLTAVLSVSLLAACGQTPAEEPAEAEETEAVEATESEGTEEAAETEKTEAETK